MWPGGLLFPTMKSILFVAWLILLLCFALASCSSQAIYFQAKTWEGKSYKHGQGRKCADWVAHVVRKSGETPPSGYAKASSWMKWGRPVSRAAIMPGDVVIFKNTYKRGISHIGIAIGDGKFIHRSTYRAPVKVDSLTGYSIAGVRRAI